MIREILPTVAGSFLGAGAALGAAFILITASLMGWLRDEEAQQLRDRAEWERMDGPPPPRNVPPDALPPAAGRAARDPLLKRAILLPLVAAGLAASWLVAQLGLRVSAAVAAVALLLIIV